MATSGSGHVTARTVFVLGLALSILSISTFNLKRIWQPIGVYGYGTNIDGVVTGVDPGSPAARAGIGVGDRLDETKMTPKELEELIQLPQVASPGITRTFDVLRGDTRRTVSITSEPEPMGASDVTGLVATWIGGLLFIGIGAAIVLLRPEPATWGFYLFCVGYAPADWTALYVTSGAPAIQIEQIIQGLVNAAAVVGLIAFSLYFLHPILGGWRRIVLGCLPVIYLAVVAVYTDEVVNTYLLARPAEAAAHLGIALNVLCSIIVVVALTDTLVRRRGAERQRIRWVVLGFGIALLTSIAESIIGTEASNTPYIVQDLLGLLSLFAPISVAYAVIKHRVIDVNFVVSRTLVYGVLTTVFVGLFALIDWVIGHVLDQSRWALITEICVAISVGFWLNGLHNRIDRFVDSVLFRRRHAAERRLATLARGLPHADSMQRVDTSLIAEPRDALDLTSSALFRREAGGSYLRVNSSEWPEHGAQSLASDDPLIIYLQAERAAVRLADVHWSRTDGPGGAARPAIALPILVRHELDAVALYGSHRGGEDFDPDEMAWLNALGAAAGAAYDHLEADALRAELERISKESEARRVALERHGLMPVESA